MKKWMYWAIAGIAVLIAGGATFLDFSIPEQVIPPLVATAPESGPQEPVQAGGEAVTASQTPAVGVNIGNIPPDFSLTDLAGETVNLSDYQGKRILLNFWSTECPPCVAEMPMLNEFYLENQEQDFALLAVNLAESKDKVAAFAETYELTFPILLDSTLDTAYRYGIMYMPTSFFINEEGLIEDVMIGMLREETLIGFLETK